MFNLIVEGGGAGHMDHPFDLQGVNTGKDLLDFFQTAKKMLEKKAGGSVKIDGVNVSFKVVDQDDIKQMAVDRGSLAMIDIEGITASRINNRFPEGHGMRAAITTLLNILNGSIDKIKPELEALGMWDDPTKFLNTEYVEGTTNVTAYDENFLAIHGLNQFYEKTAKSGPSRGNYRPGLERPMVWSPKKKKMVLLPDPSREIPYDPAVMERLVEKLKPLAEEYGFQVYSSVPTEKTDVDIDYSDALNEPFTVRISDDTKITKTMGEWLNEATNPRYHIVTLQDEFPELGLKRKTHALHKSLYLAILHQALPITELIADADAEAAIYGAVFMHATRILGNEVLRALTSPMGDLTDHEGAVLRDEKKFGPKPVKITGEFIVGNLAGGYGNIKEQEEDSIDLTIVDDPQPEPTPVAGESIALVPGSFKPPHAGHLAMVQEYAKNHDKVLVLISKPLKKQRTLADGTVITATDAKKLWEILLGPSTNVDVQISDQASPVRSVYEFVGNDGDLNPGDVITLGCSSKGCDYNRWRDAGKYIKDGVGFKDPEATAVEPARHSQDYMNILSQSPVGENMPSVTDSNKDPADFHASDMRYLLGVAAKMPEAVELLDDFTNNNTEMFLNILGIDTGLNEPLDEESGAGAIGGYSLSLGAKPRRKKKKNEYYEPELYKEVLNLIIKKGIIQ